MATYHVKWPSYIQDIPQSYMGYDYHMFSGQVQFFGYSTHMQSNMAC